MARIDKFINSLHSKKKLKSRLRSPVKYLTVWKLK